MNRETKRAMARQQRTTDQGERMQQLRRQQATKTREAAGARSQTASGGRRRGLGGIGSFGGEVMAELRKVNWPDRRTVAGYTLVVLVAVTVITAIIFGLDYLFGQAIVALYT
jgi:preprotein translocase subunit SecE